MTTTNTTDSKQGGALKPCPFCGSDNLNLSDGYDEDANWVVVCRVCRSSGTFCALKKVAMARWNSRASLAAVEGDAQVSLEAVTQAIEAACEDYRVSHNARIAILNAVAAVSSPLPAEPPPIPNRICDYRNKECAAYGQTVGTRWICNNHICEQLQRCWLNAKRAAPAEPRQEGEQEKSPEEVAHEDSYWDDPLRGTNKC